MSHACAVLCSHPCALHTEDRVLLPDISFTQSQLESALREAKSFLAEYEGSAETSPSFGLKNNVMPEWAPRMLRKKGVPGAVIEKIGSLTFVKRRPEDVTPFLRHVQDAYEAQRPLFFRVAFGPLKNMQCNGANQNPDLAEYLTVIQLARFMMQVAPLYPHGIKVQLVPDDKRAQCANRCPSCYTHCYIVGLRDMVKALGFADWLQVEEGQTRLYAEYRVPDYMAAAEGKILHWQKNDPESFAARWATAMENAGRNIAPEQANDDAGEVSSAAWRYLVAHQAEILSGLWSAPQVFPLVYANHPNNYQLYSLGHKKTKLPWQIALPVNLVSPELISSSVFSPPR